MKKYLWIGTVSFLAGFLLAGYFLLSPEKPAPVSVSDKPGLTLNNHLLAAEKSLPAPEVLSSQDFVRVAEKVGPAVVRVVAERVEQVPVFGFDEDWPFRVVLGQFFGNPRGPATGSNVNSGLRLKAPVSSFLPTDTF